MDIFGRKPYKNSITLAPSSHRIFMKNSHALPLAALLAALLLLFGMAGTAKSQIIPTITSIAPVQLFKGLGDQTVIIKGVNFGTNPTVTITGGGQDATVSPVSASTSTIVVTIPSSFTTLLNMVTLTITSADREPVSIAIPVTCASNLIIALSPSTTTASLQAFTLRLSLSCSPFLPNSKVIFTDATGSLQLKPVVRTDINEANSYIDVEIPASRNVFGGYPTIRVVNPDGSLAKWILTIASRPRPGIYTINPTFVLAGSEQVILTIKGANFDPGVFVQLSEVNLEITSYSRTELNVTVPASLVRNKGLLVVVVFNPDKQVAGARMPVIPIGEVTPFR